MHIPITDEELARLDRALERLVDLGPADRARALEHLTEAEPSFAAALRRALEAPATLLERGVSALASDAASMARGEASGGFTPAAVGDTMRQLIPPQASQESDMPDPRTDVNRRAFLGASLGAVATGALAPSGVLRTTDVTPLKGRLKQSVCKWCYDKIPLDDLCRAAAQIGLRSVELLGEHDWDVPKKYGLTCAMANGPSTITVGFNRPSEHDRLVAESERLLPLVAKSGLPNMIVFSGNRGGMSDGEGLENCVRGLQRITPLAERLGVTVCMELLNSKVDHKDYMCDHTAWGAELVKRVGSSRFRLLYDIYHMQIMEGDVIRTIRDNFAHIAHFHTGGVPGRAEIDETQELYYPQVCRAILDLGFTGYLAQEFVPARDPLTSLREGAAICDV